MFPSQIDPRVAADKSQQFEGSISASLLQRLAAAVLEIGQVEAEVSFWVDEQRRCRVSGSIWADTTLECQRCLQPFPLQLRSDIEGAVVWSDEQARQLPVELDPWLAQERGLDVVRALEDELLLALPTMAVHRDTECSGQSHISVGPEQKRNKPFAELERLMRDQGETH